MKKYIFLIAVALFFISQSGLFLKPANASINDNPLYQTESLYTYNFDSFIYSPLFQSSSKPLDTTPTRRSSTSTHKYFGWGAVVTGVVAGITGAYDMTDRMDGRMPSLSRRLAHSIFSYTAAGLAIGACASGLVEYGNIFNSGEGFSRYNTHFVTGLVSTLGFVTAMVMARARMSYKGNTVEDAYEAHGYVAAGSGALMMLSVAVLKF
jgi:hypothetical protein